MNSRAIQSLAAIKKIRRWKRNERTDNKKPGTICCIILRDCRHFVSKFKHGNPRRITLHYNCLFGYKSKKSEIYSLYSLNYL